MGIIRCVTTRVVGVLTLSLGVIVVPVGAGWPPSNCEINPPRPACDVIPTVSVGGSWPNSCIPVLTRVAVEGATVQVDFREGSGPYCLQVFTAYGGSETLDTSLPPGPYTVVATLFDRFGSVTAGPSELCSFTVDAHFADIDGDGEVGTSDYLAILQAWGNKGGPEDVDGDGVVGYGDVLVVLVEWGPCGSRCGRGLFEPPVDYDFGGRPEAVALADLDDDLDLDLVVAYRNGSVVDVALNDGTGAFAPPVAYGDAGTDTIAAGDIDDDEDLDLAFIGSEGVSLLLNDGNAGFSPGGVVDVGPRADIALADLDGDGAVDLAVANGSAGTVSVHLNDGSGLFGPATAYGAGSSYFDLSVADMDGDLDLDLVLADAADRVAVFLNNGDASFGPESTYFVGIVDALALGDLDGDGDNDVAVAADFEGGAVLLNDGSGSLAPAGIVAEHFFASDVVVGDLSGDGRDDIGFVSNTFTTVSVVISRGRGVFASELRPAELTDRASAATLGDVDGDGDDDLVVALSRDLITVLTRNCSAGCRADLDFSGAVDAGDIAVVLDAWGDDGGRADLDYSRHVGYADLQIVLAEFGPCPRP